MAEKSVKVSTQLGMTKLPGRHIRLICLTGKNKGVSYYLIGQRTLMGRGNDVDIQIADENASIQHIELVLVNNEIVITDLKSQNGLFVNDTKTIQTQLQDGDTIVIGRTVYKFNDIFNRDIVRENPEDAEAEEEDDDDDNDDDTQTNSASSKRRKPLILIVGVMIVYILFADDEEPERKTASTIPIVKEESIIPVTTKDVDIDPELKAKLTIFIHRGIREYREGNYFRAITEFDMAATLNPTDGRANFYRRQASDKITETIENLFIKATRQRDALKFQAAIVSLCEVVKLLVHYEDETKEKQANDMLKEIQKKMGVEYREDYCLTK